jgi:hypothetical protein
MEREFMRSSICIAVLSGMFLLMAVALHDFLTPVFGASGDQVFMEQYGRVYVVATGGTLALKNR